MTVCRSENGLLFASDVLAFDDSSQAYSLMQAPTGILAGTGGATAGNHVAFLLEGHHQQHQLQSQRPQHLSQVGEAARQQATITVNPMTVVAEHGMPIVVDDSPCQERKKTFYILISLIVLGISVMVITVITAVVIFCKCESLSRLLDSLFPSFPLSSAVNWVSPFGLSFSSAFLRFIDESCRPFLLSSLTLTTRQAKDTRCSTLDRRKQTAEP